MPDGAQPCESYTGLREAIERAIKILDRNLGHQTEKCYDALAILRRSLQEN